MRGNDVHTLSAVRVQLDGGLAGNVAACVNVVNAAAAFSAVYEKQHFSQKEVPSQCILCKVRCSEMLYDHCVSLSSLYSHDKSSLWECVVPMHHVLMCHIGCA